LFVRVYYYVLLSNLVLIVSNFIVACAFVTCYQNHTYLLTYSLING